MIVSVHKLLANLPIRGFHALEVKFFQFNLLHLRPGRHYTPVGCHEMPKTLHGGFAYTPIFTTSLTGG